MLEIMGSSQKRSNFKEFTYKFSIDCCDQSSLDNIYIKLLTYKTEKYFLLTTKN